MSRFDQTYCSQCGGEFGPGDEGYSHCKDHAKPGDTLDMAYINSLPQPFLGRMLGGGWWPIHDFEVQTGLVRIDVCGKLQAEHIGDFTAFRDGAGVERSAEAFYVDANEDERAAVAAGVAAPSQPLSEARIIDRAHRRAWRFKMLDEQHGCTTYLFRDTDLINLARDLEAAHRDGVDVLGEGKSNG